MSPERTPVLSPAPPNATTVDAVIITAMDSELAPFERRASDLSTPRQVGHARTSLATVSGRRLLLVRSGIGTVNAAVATALAVHAVRTSIVVSSGSAGGLGVGVRVGDVVVGSDYTYSDADATAFGYTLGQVPGMPVSYPGAPALVERAKARSGVLVGQMVTSDSFVDARMVDHVRAAFPHALTTDMESAAIAQACHSFGLPFVSVRGISDLCGPSAGEAFNLAVDDVAALAADLALDLATGQSAS
ncbi:5'-methylthioadenosine/S-adenosylhomocysteine nucleosidase [Georgenia faecalis]|uniref:adenosylhomocysteine nucleosidase n=1 Tax=Georgenia faecalis TaxID=2483799 RepID=A0ABV9D9I5_9MICO|nr:5'-methylthioadenosine/S-adenosylhomocysteine nucleosidase [Georgenia faecalis]